MSSLLKIPSEYIQCNGKYVTANKVVHDDFINNSLFIDSGTVQSIDKISNSICIETIIDKQYYLKNDKVLSKGFYDFDENLYQVSRVDELTLNDFTLLMKSSCYIDRSTTVFDTTPYLYLDTYDISIISKKLCGVIGVSKSFLMQSLRVGVPDNELFNSKLNNYLVMNGYESTEEFKKDLFLENCTPVKKKLPITKAFLNLLFIYLLGDYVIDEEDITLDISRLSSPELILGLLNTLSLNYTVLDEKHILCASSFLMELFKDSFGDLFILSHMHSKFDKYLLNFLQEQKFVTGTKKSLMYVQNFLFGHKVLSTIEQSVDDFILTIIPPDMYVTLDIGYLLPIVSISSNTEPTLKFNF